MSGFFTMGHEWSPPREGGVAWLKTLLISYPAGSVRDL